jgi:hypothetical protein
LEALGWKTGFTNCSDRFLPRIFLGDDRSKRSAVDVIVVEEFKGLGFQQRLKEFLKSFLFSERLE